MTNALVQVRNDACEEVTREDAWQEPHELYTKLMSCTSRSMSCHPPGIGLSLRGASFGPVHERG